MNTAPMDSDITVPLRRTQQLDIRFTGSGSEYFRIWIVNLLLTVVTLGLYLPFAKARRLRYFHENTLVGEAPLSFHGEPWRMLRGYALIGVLTLAYLLMSHLWPLGAGLLLLAMLPLGPWMLWSALRFRLGQTGWRGLRFRFDGRLGDAYRVFWPALLPALAILLGQVLQLGAVAQAEASGTPPDLAGYELISMLGTLVLTLLMPWLSWRLKSYQHGHYRLGDEVTQLGVGFGSFYRVQLTLGGIGLLVGLGVVALIFTLVKSGSAALAPLLIVVIYVGGGGLLGGFYLSRMQNLVWSHTHSAHAQFHSALALWPLVGLLMKNTVLIGLSAGLYWPFAAIALARQRLQAVSLTLSRPVEQLTASAANASPGAAGEAAADLNPLGFDIDF